MSDTPAPKKKAPDDECLGWAISKRRKCELTISAKRLKDGCLTCNTHKEYEKTLQRDFDLEAYARDNQYHREFFRKHFPELFELPESAVHVRLPDAPVKIELSIPQVAELAQSIAGAWRQPSKADGDGRTTGKRTLLEVAAISTIIGIALATLSAIANAIVYGSLGFNYFAYATQADHVAAAFEMSPWILLGAVAVTLGLWWRAQRQFWEARDETRDLAGQLREARARASKVIGRLERRIGLLRIAAALATILPAAKTRIDDRIRTHEASLALKRQPYEARLKDLEIQLDEAAARERERKAVLTRREFLDFFDILFKPSGPFVAFATIFLFVAAGSLIKVWYFNGGFFCWRSEAYYVDGTGVPRDRRFTVIARLDKVYFLRRRSDPTDLRVVASDLVNLISILPLEDPCTERCPGGGKGDEGGDLSITSFHIQSGETASPASPTGFGDMSFFYFVDGERVNFSGGTIPLPLFPATARGEYIKHYGVRTALGGDGEWSGVDTMADAYAFGSLFLSQLKYTTDPDLYNEGEAAEEVVAAGQPADADKRTELDYFDQVKERLQACGTTSKPLQIDVIGFASDDPFTDKAGEALDHSNALNHALAEGRRAAILQKLGFELNPEIPNGQRADQSMRSGNLELVDGSGQPVSRLPMKVTLDVTKGNLDELTKAMQPNPKIDRNNDAASRDPDRFGFRFKSFDEMKKWRDGEQNHAVGSDPSRVESILSRSVVIRIPPEQRCPPKKPASPN